MKYLTKKIFKKVYIEGKEIEMVGYEPENPTEEIYYLEPPPPQTFEEQIKKLIFHMFYRLLMKSWHMGSGFNPHEFLRIQEVDEKMKTEMLRLLRNTLSFFPDDMVDKHYKNMREYIKTFKPEALPPQPIDKQKPKLKIDQIALKSVYEGLQITRDNGKEIAKEYGHNSGEKLFQRFTYYSSTANRKGKPFPCTRKKFQNKIKLIESVIELLPTNKQNMAKDEVKILKNLYQAEFE